jgi:hypothetical protein
VLDYQGTVAVVLIWIASQARNDGKRVGICTAHGCWAVVAVVAVVETRHATSLHGLRDGGVVNKIIAPKKHFK